MTQGDTRTLAAFLVYIQDIHALGLAATKGLTFPASFYWNQNDPARSFALVSRRRPGSSPSKDQEALTDEHY